MRRGRYALAAAVSLALVAGCAEEEVEDAPAVVVEGGPGGEPEIFFEAPLAIAEGSFEVVWEGAGDRLVPDEPVLLHYRLQDATTGELIDETYQGLPKAYLLEPESLSLDLYRALDGQSAGARLLVLVAESEDGAGGPAVLVTDVLASRAVGAEVDQRDDLPAVDLAEDGRPSISQPEGEAPADLVVQTLIKGAGEQVVEGASVVVRYTGFRWSDGEEFDSRWDERGPVGFDLTQAISGWSTGLVEQTVGSQVLLVVPPALAYGGDAEHELAEETLVFVIDILAATEPEALE